MYKDFQKMVLRNFLDIFLLITYKNYYTVIFSIFQDGIVDRAISHPVAHRRKARSSEPASIITVRCSRRR